MQRWHCLIHNGTLNTLINNDTIWIWYWYDIDMILIYYTDMILIYYTDMILIYYTDKNKKYIFKKFFVLFSLSGVTSTIAKFNLERLFLGFRSVYCSNLQYTVHSTLTEVGFNRFSREWNKEHKEHV